MNEISAAEQRGWIQGMADMAKLLNDLADKFEQDASKRLFGRRRLRDMAIVLRQIAIDVPLVMAMHTIAKQ